MPVAATPAPHLAKRHYKSLELKQSGGGPIDARTPLLFNEDVVVGLVRLTAADPVYFSNADGDDLFFVLRGGGVLRTLVGDLRF